MRPVYKKAANFKTPPNSKTKATDESSLKWKRYRYKIYTQRMPHKSSPDPKIKGDCKWYGRL